MQRAEYGMTGKAVLGREWGNGYAGKAAFLLLDRGWILFPAGFLFGRALLLSQLSPFALSFFAAVFVMRKEMAPRVCIAVLAGAFTVSPLNTVSTFAVLFSFLLLHRLFRTLHKGETAPVPFFVFFTILTVKSILAYTVNGPEFVPAYDLVLAAVEASLAFVLTLIFMQCLPFLSLSGRIRTLKTEEWIGLLIVFASAATGMVGWSIGGLEADHIAARYLVTAISFLSGAAFGSAAGVVSGLILSLAGVSDFHEMSILAFAGLLGGLFKEWKRGGAVAGLMAATVLAGFYGEGDIMNMTTLYESAAAALLLFMTPKAWTDHVSKLIPGTTEHSIEQQRYLRKVRDVTSDRMEQFSDLFDALADSFSQPNQPLEGEDREFDLFLSGVTEKTCQTCFKKEQCWVYQFDDTYKLMKDILEEVDTEKDSLSPPLVKELETRCFRPVRVEEEIRSQLTYYRANKELKQQMRDSRKIVADQLEGVSKVMRDFASEMQREEAAHCTQEEKITSAIESFGMEITDIDVFSVQKGAIDIEMTIPYSKGHGESEKIIAPILSELLDEYIIVVREQEDGSGMRSVFRSAKAFRIVTGLAHAAKGGGLVSGDSFSAIEIGTGKFALAISDGMGNGDRAHDESSATISLLKRILQSGIEEKVAVKSINSILSLRTNDEVFSTLDLAIIDLQDAQTVFLKVGSSPSFIKRGDQVIKVESGNLPIGILQQFEVDTVHEQLKSGDLLIMMSDGVFEGPDFIENADIWMKRKIKSIETNDPQQFADLLMDEVIRTQAGEIKDDMTLCVARVEHNLPEWAAIPIYDIEPSEKRKKRPMRRRAV
ncbi:MULTISPECIES: stage II sporulation protein E [Bacillaceae]|uniref:Stage II sporulation protein E n=2 Tax=Domibacillus aminovorans TaxID=29332 RepID=A0A177KUI7_9BACI|nr:MULTISPECIES: stage II sporulation protein E [Bacillaceae]OAH56786.1 stage II sporulation protein E [Domibacillus aminovorans]